MELHALKALLLFLSSILSDLHCLVMPKLSSLKVLHSNENGRFSRGGNWMASALLRQLSSEETAIVCWAEYRTFLFSVMWTPSLYTVCFKRWLSLKKKDPLATLKRIYDTKVGRKGFLNASSQQVSFLIKETSLSQTGYVGKLCS